jgi:hypothetical protein
VLLQVLTRPLVQEGEEAIPRIISIMQVSRHAQLEPLCWGCELLNTSRDSW